MPEFFETRMGQKFYEGTMPRLVRAIEDVVAATRDGQTLTAIQAVLDRQEWTPDTLDAIAELVRGSGRPVRSPESPDGGV